MTPVLTEMGLSVIALKTPESSVAQRALVLPALTYTFVGSQRATDIV